MTLKERVTEQEVEQKRQKGYRLNCSRNVTKQISYQVKDRTYQYSEGLEQQAKIFEDILACLAPVDGKEDYVQKKIAAVRNMRLGLYSSGHTNRFELLIAKVIEYQVILLHLKFKKNGCQAGDRKKRMKQYNEEVQLWKKEVRAKQEKDRAQKQREAKAIFRQAAARAKAKNDQAAAKRVKEELARKQKADAERLKKEEKQKRIASTHCHKCGKSKKAGEAEICWCCQRYERRKALGHRRPIFRGQNARGY